LAHSGTFAACGCISASSGQLGVDVEEHRSRDFLRLAAFAFAASEREALASLQARAQAHVFYQLWTLKEAFAKALGVPLLEATRTCVFDTAEMTGAVPTSERPWRAWIWMPRPHVTLALATIDVEVTETALIESPAAHQASWPLAAYLSG